MNIYKRKQRWKRLLLLAAMAIAVVSMLYTNKLVKRLSDEERKKVMLWSTATKRIAQEMTDFSFELEVITNNTTIPVILTEDDRKTIKSFVNLDSARTKDKNYLAKRLEHMKAKHEPLEIVYEVDPVTHRTAANYVFYDDSTLLVQLRYYPYIQLAVVSIFLLVSYFAFSSSRRAEQNQVWVGMAKETAHQLGTPISSLIAWVEYLKLKGIETAITDEIQKDIERLSTITERFSKIGGAPDLQPTDLEALLKHAVNYLEIRSPQTVKFDVQNLMNHKAVAAINISLFEWVIENLCKNAIDAMDGKGAINIKLSEVNKHIAIDICDTGKGIPKNLFKTVFNPGFTTKSRGWGLGLSLAKRIINEYHSGNIFVKGSDPGKGTTFRILLKKEV